MKKKFEEISPIIENKIKEIDKKAIVIENKEKKLKKKHDYIEEDKKEIETLKLSLINTKREIINLSKKNTKNIKDKIKKPSPVSKSVLEELIEIRKLRPRYTSFPSTDESTIKLKKQEHKYVKIVIKTKPDDAKIIVNNEEIVIGNFSGLYKQGEIIKLKVEKADYETFEKEITASKDENKILIELKEKPQEKLQKKETTKISQEKIEITQKPEKEKSSEIKEEMKIKRDTPIIWEISPTDKAIVRKINNINNIIIFSDTTGNIIAISTNGKKLWKIKTLNSPNENSYPVVDSNFVYFTGAKEFVIIDINSGKIVKKLKIGKNDLSSHIFGRRVIIYNSSIIYPSNNKLIILNKKTLKIERKISLPESSYATPSIYKNQILALDQKGDFLIINYSSGVIKTKIQTKALQPVSLAPVIKNNKAFFAGRKGTIVAIDLESKKVLWHKTLSNNKKGIFQDITIGKELIYPYTNNKIYAISQKDGSLTFGPIESTCPPLFYNGKIYYGSPDSKIIIANAQNGQIMKSLQLGDVITSKPAIIDENIIIGTKTRKLYMLNPEAFN